MEKLLVPKNFNAKALLEKFNYTSDLKLKEFHLNYVMHTALSLTYESYFRDVEIGWNRGLFSLSTEAMYKTLGRYYKLALDCLNENNILILYSNYYEGRCRKYYLNPLYCLESKIINLSKSEIITVKKGLFKMPSSQTVNWLDKSREFLFETIESENLTFSNDVFDKIIEIQNSVCTYPTKKGGIYSEEVEFSLLKDRLNKFILGCRLGHHSDSFGFRFHSLLTNIRSELRPYLRYKGEPLVEIDVKNCQPFLLLSFFNPNYWYPLFGNDNNASFSLFSFDRELYNYIQSFHFTFISIILSSSNREFAGIEYQRNLFRRNVVKGTIYEQLMGFLGLESLNEDKNKELRKEVKKDFISYLNDKPSKRPFQKYFNGKVGYAFKVHYPHISTLVDSLKSFQTGELVNYGKTSTRLNKLTGYRERKKVDSGYKKLSSVMQKMESFLIIDNVCKNLKERFPEMPIITVHDCILTTSEYVDAVINEIESVFGRYIGEIPKLEIEN